MARARDLAGRRQVRREIQNVVCLPFPPSGDLAAREAAREAAGGARHDASTSTREVEGGGARRSTRVTLGAQRTLSAVTRSTTTFRREVSFRRFCRLARISDGPTARQKPRGGSNPRNAEKKNSGRKRAN